MEESTSKILEITNHGNSFMIRVGSEDGTNGIVVLQENGVQVLIGRLCTIQEFLDKKEQALVKKEFVSHQRKPEAALLALVINAMNKSIVVL